MKQDVEIHSYTAPKKDISQTARDMKYLSIIILSIFIFGCASIPDAQQPTPEPQQPINVALKAQITEAIKGKINKREAIYLELGVIPGALYGKPIDEPFWYIDMNEDSAPSLDFARFPRELNNYAENWKDIEANNGLIMTPSNTKIMRLSTFGFDVENKKYLAGGLQDEKGNFIILVYFNKPCTITGIKDFGASGVFNHNITIDSAGLYKLAARQENGQYTFVVERSLESIIVVLK